MTSRVRGLIFPAMEEWRVAQIVEVLGDIRDQLVRIADTMERSEKRDEAAGEAIQTLHGLFGDTEGGNHG